MHAASKYEKRLIIWVNKTQRLSYKCTSMADDACKGKKTKIRPVELNWRQKVVKRWSIYMHMKMFRSLLRLSAGVYIYIYIYIENWEL